MRKLLERIQKALKEGGFADPFVGMLPGELKRDIIDYETIKQAMTKMSKDLKQSFLEKLEGKLEEIEGDIKTLYSERLAVDKK